jgi:hypothetical protein
MMSIDCQSCVALLSEFVRCELAGLHVAGCPACESAYYREFRRQGAELRAAARQSALWPGVTAVLAIVTPGSGSNWSERALDFGRAWVDRITGELRRLDVRFADLRQAPPPALTLALGGLQGTQGEMPPLDLPQGSVQGDGFDLAVHLLPDPEGDQTVCRVELIVTAHAAFGDYSGAEVTLLTPHGVQTAVTDPLGAVVFAGIARQDVDAIQFSIRMPDL